jgi:coenzyme Q-binding protein COQ10
MQDKAARRFSPNLPSRPVTNGQNPMAIPTSINPPADDRRRQETRLSDRAQPAADNTIVKTVPHRWEDIFGLVMDVQSYPAFVPYCREVRRLSRKTDGDTRTIVVSSMTVGFAAVNVSYATRTVGDTDLRRITVEAIDGPLRRLHAVWQLTPIGDDRTEIAFSVDYEFANPLLAAVASGVLGSMFGEMVDAFERRAAQTFGRRDPA